MGAGNQNDNYVLVHILGWGCSVSCFRWNDAPNKKNFKVVDEGIPFFLLSFMWPFVIAICAAALVVFGIVSFAGFLWSFLMELGSSFGRKLETPKKEEVLKEDECGE